MKKLNIPMRQAGYVCMALMAMSAMSCKASGNEKSADPADSNQPTEVINDMADAEATESAEETKALSLETLEGTWELYNTLKGNKTMIMTFDSDGLMWLSRILYVYAEPGMEVLDVEPVTSYHGTYNIEGNEIKYCIGDTNKDYAEDVRGAIKAKLVGNFMDITFDDGLIGVANNGDTFRMFNTAEMYPAKLSAKPSVVDMFKAALPFVYEPTIRDAASLIIDNKQPDPDMPASKTVDLKAGYISYEGGGAPASAMEACIWRCDDATTLLAINVLGESVNDRPTTRFYLFRYYPDLNSIMRLDKDSENIFFYSQYVKVAISLPRQGKDIKRSTLNAAYEIEDTETIPWTGNGFELVK